MLSYRLRHRIRIEKVSQSQDPDTGAINNEWQVLQIGGVIFDTVPAEVLTGPGRELQLSSAIQAEGSARINMRWFPGLDSTMRIIWEEQIFNIHSIEMDRTGRREYRLRCTSGVNKG